MRSCHRFGRVARLGKSTVAVAALSLVAAAGPAVGLLSHGAVAASAVLELQRPRQPQPLRGSPLVGATGLRLVVAGNPPLLLDVDTGRVTTVPGVPAMKRGLLWVVGVGGRAAVVVAQSSWPRASLYAVRGQGTRVSFLGFGTYVTPAGDGRAVWVQSFIDRSHCTLRQVGLDGRKLRAARPFPCASTSDPPGSSLGLVVRRTRLVDPLTGRTKLETRWGILAAAGDKLLLAGPGKQFTLLDAVTGTQRRLPWPSILRGGDEPTVDPRGRHIALAFADPAWAGGPQQALDVWLLDTETGKLTQLPGMPALVSLKFTSMSWTDDGRLVLLAQQRDGKDIVAVWRPGEQRLAMKTVGLPAPTSGSDSFAPLRY